MKAHISCFSTPLTCGAERRCVDGDEAVKGAVAISACGACSATARMYVRICGQSIL
jgi:hypothetical protein